MYKMRLHQNGFAITLLRSLNCSTKYICLTSETVYRGYHNQSYFDYIQNQKKTIFAQTPGAILSPEVEFEYFIDVLEHKYDYNCISYLDPDTSMTYQELIGIEKSIYDKEFTFDRFHGKVELAEEESYPIYYSLPKNMNYCYYPHERKFLYIDLESEKDILVLDSLSLFLQFRMQERFIGSTYRFSSICEYYKPHRLMFCWNNVQRKYIKSIENMYPCILGCYINLFPIICQVDRYSLLSSLKDHISSSKILHLLSTFLNRKVVLPEKRSSQQIRSSLRGLLPVGSLTMTLLDFYFYELDFIFSKSKLHSSRHNLNIFIGLPTSLSMEDDPNLNFLLGEVNKALLEMNIQSSSLIFNILEPDKEMKLFDGNLMFPSSSLMFHYIKGPHEFQDE